MYKIECKPLTVDRKNQIASLEIPPLGRPLRIILAAGGAYIFYYGTSIGVPDAVKGIAVLFAAIGIAAVLLAIFSQKLIEIRYFIKLFKEGRFPSEVKAGEGGIALTYKTIDKNTSESVEKERYFFYSQTGKTEDHGKFFKLWLTPDSADGKDGGFFVYIFKEDFEGSPEAFLLFIESKKPMQ